MHRSQEHTLCTTCTSCDQPNQKEPPRDTQNFDQGHLAVFANFAERSLLLMLLRILPLLLLQRVLGSPGSCQRDFRRLFLALPGTATMLRISHDKTNCAQAPCGQWNQGRPLACL